MKKVLILLLAMLAIALVVYFCVYGKSIPNIEKDLSFRAQDQLNTNKMEWARVNIDGRDVTLVGAAPSAEQRDAAQRIAQVEGVNFVENKLTIGTDGLANNGENDKPNNLSNTVTAHVAIGVDTPSEDDYSLMISKDKEGKFVVEGVMNVAMHQRVMTEATAKMGVDQLIDRITDKDVESPKELPAIANIMLTRVAALEDGQAHLVGKKLQVSGSSPTKAAIEQIKQQTASGLPEGFESSFNLKPPAAIEKNNDLPIPSVETDPKIAQMSSKKCQRQFNKILANSKIYFNSSSSVVKKSSYKTLSQLAKTANQCVSYNIKIHGHTDTTGRNQLNQQLSKKRAQAVARYLAEKGVNPKHIHAIGHGSSKPIASNKTSEGRARNRRIELTVED